MRTRGLQPRLLYPARFSIKMEGEIKRSADKRRLKEYTSTKPALPDILETPLTRGRKRVRERNTGRKGVKWK